MSNDNGKELSPSAKRKINQAKIIADFVGQGFHKLDDDLISTHPPKIKWGIQYQNMSDKEKIAYLEKLAATMNHAAYLIQEERNNILIFNGQQEDKIIEMAKALETNQDMVVSEITKVNNERQEMNKSGSKMKGDKIREYLNNVNNSGSKS